jgi:RNA polymerase sigma-54 factor
MAQELSQQQSLIQTQTQTLAPQQLLVVRLLELPVSDLEGRVRNELMENSALEEAPSSESEDRREEGSGDENSGEDSYDKENGDDFTSEDAYNADQRADYASDDDMPDYLLNQSNDSGEQRTFQLGGTDSFYDRLVNQLGEYDVSDKQREIIKYLIGSLDGDGLLRKDTAAISDELAIYHNVDATVGEIEEALHTLQTFEPCGIAARNLQECLLLQLRDEDYHSAYKDLEIQMLERSFDDFTHKRLEKLSERYHLSGEEMKKIYGELTHLNPRPGSGLSDSTGQNMQQIIPDFLVTEDENGEFIVRLNNGDVPQLRVSRSFRDLVEEYSKNRKNMSREQKDAYVYSKQKVDAAQNFINAIRQRRETLMKTMTTIVALQRPFFEEGDEALLHPMILKDVAERTGLDISTISRVSNSKYVQTDFGVFPLKFFFNDTFVTKEGEELSKVKIKTTLKELIGSENKSEPLSDETLASLLKKKGFAVARRTVAKYREQLGIPVARLRK